MDKFKWVAGWVAATILALVGVTGSASAANESITLRTSVLPRGGKLYKEKRVPANMSLSVQVHTPAASPKVSPLKRAVMQFPRDLTYNPNNRRTPVCSESKLNERSNLAVGVARIIALCPRSVIGTGTASIYLAKVHSPATLVDDPQLVIFNAGRDSHGNARMKIYAYSKTTNVGILMRGSLTRRGIQDVAIPVLSADSATAEFTLSIPGGMQTESPDGGTQFVKGRDPAYARAKCSTGKLTTGGTFTLGERAYPSGTDTGPETTVEATPYTDLCKGLRGRPRLNKLRAKGPRRLRRGSRRVFRVHVKNSGTATARQVRIKASGSGRGRARTANIQPGGSRWVRVKVRVTGRKGRRARIVFRVKAKRAHGRAVARGRILR